MSLLTETEKSIDKHEPLLTIGVIAKKLGIAVQTVRLYEQEGLIIAHKTASGRRMFSLHDLERLQCIRTMITEHAMNLQGIKRIMALIPCWELKGGLDEECQQCPAYYEASGPCWSISNVSEKCQLQDCRSCKVYQINMACSKLKEIIFGHKRPQQQQLNGKDEQ